MSVKEDEEECPLHNNYGLVFPKAWVNADNVIVPSFAGNLKVAAVKKDGADTYLITGEDWKSDGSVNGENKGFFWLCHLPFCMKCIPMMLNTLCHFIWYCNLIGHSNCLKRQTCFFTQLCS